MNKNNEYIVDKNLELRGFKKTKSKKNKEKDEFALAKSLNIGYYLLVPLLVGTLIGWLADSYFRTKPVLAIIGIILGTISTFYNLYKLIK